jgi:hypothetical protein
MRWSLPVNWETAFGAANMLALAAWAALIVMPRRPALLAFLRNFVVSAFLIAYAALMMMFFARTDGGFGSLAECPAPRRGPRSR